MFSLISKLFQASLTPISLNKLGETLSQEWWFKREVAMRRELGKGNTVLRASKPSVLPRRQLPIKAKMYLVDETEGSVIL